MRIMPRSSSTPLVFPVFKYVYPRLWPIAFLAFGLLAAGGTHVSFELAGLRINSHNLMWFLMALAHADVFWRGRNGAEPQPHH